MAVNVCLSGNLLRKQRSIFDIVQGLSSLARGALLGWFRLGVQAAKAADLFSMQRNTSSPGPPLSA